MQCRLQTPTRRSSDSVQVQAACTGVPARNAARRALSFFRIGQLRMEPSVLAAHGRSNTFFVMIVSRAWPGISAVHINNETCASADATARAGSIRCSSLLSAPTLADMIDHAKYGAGLQCAANKQQAANRGFRTIGVVNVMEIQPRQATSTLASRMVAPRSRQVLRLAHHIG